MERNTVRNSPRNATVAQRCCGSLSLRLQLFIFQSVRERNRVLLLPLYPQRNATHTPFRGVAVAR